MASDTKSLNLHLVSDSTGETLNHVARACVAQFEGAPVTQHVWPLIRSERQMSMVCGVISTTPGLVLHTIIQDPLRDFLVHHCRGNNIAEIGVLDPVLNALSRALGREAQHQPGRQHALDQDYYKRIEAMEFSLACDDGQGADKLDKAEVILLGVSRTSKTPTCMYLANRGVFAANIPLVATTILPPNLFEMKKPLIVGLTRDAASLVDIRKNRLRSLNEGFETSYTERDIVEKEVNDARRLFTKHGLPVIDVSRRSIEETAAEILTLLNVRKGQI
jgi:[pyruvate, water dikinase]-phosphate phosphotransferase / [pyruvate, water dikinase] kinase